MAPPLDPVPFYEWVGDVPLLVTFAPELLGLPLIPRTRPLTSGTYCLYTLLRMFCVRRLWITGFTMFGAVSGEHQKYYQDNRPSLGTFHDLDQETQLFCAMLAQFPGELTVTAEVQALAESKGLRIGANSERPRSQPFKHWLAAGLSWRLMRMAMSLRRVAETTNLPLEINRGFQVAAPTAGIGTNGEHR
jgi:hypothetical protein